MREILFRGKRVDNGEWVEGYYIVASGMPFISVFAVREPILVVPDTIGQYTGLTDKNGNRIFEGDIIEVHTIDGNHIRRAVVEYGQYHDVNADWYDDYCLGWFIRFEGDCISILQDNKSILEICEVIGNIHDNQKLLEG